MCYHIIIPTLVVETCVKIGLNKSEGNMLQDSLTYMVNSVSKSHGDSSAKFMEEEDRPIFGTGQGSGGSPEFCYAISDIIFATIYSYGNIQVFKNTKEQYNKGE